jgi:hypothetical protein
MSQESPSKATLGAYWWECQDDVKCDLPCNPTRLEQPQVRIQSIGQIQAEIWILNLRDRDSVFDIYITAKIISDRLSCCSSNFS